MMNVLFLSNLVPPVLLEEYYLKCHNSMQNSAISFQTKIIDGIEKNIGKPLTLFNILPISSYPKYYSDSYISSFSFSHKEGADDYNVGFINIRLIKRALLQMSYIRQFKSFIKRKRFDAIICYSPNPYSVKAVQVAKRYHKNIKSCLIIPDMPEFGDLSNNVSFVRKIYVKISSRYIRSKNVFIDSFVYMTEYASSYFCPNKPYAVMEGIIDDIETKKTINKNGGISLKTIVYTGLTHSRFGVKNLVDAFSKIPYKDYQLIICGCGDSDDYIKEQSMIDKRICFKGVVSREDAIQYQLNATLLVNPRQNIGEYTKYSFPSKTMEYLSSGVPLVAYKLDGIPDEYDEYIYYVKDNNINSLTKALVYMCEKPKDERNEIGEKAKVFVRLNKNKIIQTQKILSLLVKS